MDVTFKLHGGPWDGQTISTASPCAVTADFARAILAMTRGAAVGAVVPMVSPAAGQKMVKLEGEGRPRDSDGAVCPHAYFVSDRREDDGSITVTLAHGGPQS